MIKILNILAWPLLHTCGIIFKLYHGTTLYVCFYTKSSNKVFWHKLICSHFKLDYLICMVGGHHWVVVQGVIKRLPHQRARWMLRWYELSDPGRSSFGRHVLQYRGDVSVVWTPILRVTRRVRLFASAETGRTRENKPLDLIHGFLHCYYKEIYGIRPVAREF